MAYREALEWIQSVGWDTGGGSRMGKLLLGLHNGEVYPFDLSELRGMDTEGAELGIAAIQRYVMAGEVEALRCMGRALIERYPGYVELAQAAFEAKAAVRRRWDN